MFYIIYETANTVNNKTYRGCHKTSTLEDGYLGSGVLLRRAIRKYGKGAFVRSILEFCSSEEEMYEREKTYVDVNYVNLETTYNLRCGGFGGRMADHLRQQVSNKLKRPKSVSTRDKMRIAQTGKKLSVDTKRKIGEKSRGRVPSDDARRRMAEKAKARPNNSRGTVWITDGTRNRRVAADAVIEVGWRLGRTG